MGVNNNSAPSWIGIYRGSVNQITFRRNNRDDVSKGGWN